MRCQISNNFQIDRSSLVEFDKGYSQTENGNGTQIFNLGHPQKPGKRQGQSKYGQSEMQFAVYS